MGKAHGTLRFGIIRQFLQMIVLLDAIIPPKICQLDEILVHPCDYVN